MATSKRQYNVVLDAGTEQALWQWMAHNKLTPTKAIRRLLATHPELIALADSAGVELDPDAANAGGLREKTAQNAD